MAGKSGTDLELVAFLKGLHADDKVRCGVAVVPGSAFLVPETDLCVRFSCAREEVTDLAQAMDVVDRALELIMN